MTTLFIVLAGLAAVGIGVGAWLAWRARTPSGFLMVDGKEVFAPRKYLPFLVFIDGALDTSWRDSFSQACEWWNTRLGAGVFSFGGVAYEGATSGVGIIVVSPSSEGEAARFHSTLTVRPDGQISAGPVRVGASWPHSNRLRIACHELGHAAFGLADDDVEASVMFRRGMLGGFDVDAKVLAKLKAMYA